MPYATDKVALDNEINTHFKRFICKYSIFGVLALVPSHTGRHGLQLACGVWIGLAGLTTLADACKSYSTCAIQDTRTPPVHQQCQFATCQKNMLKDESQFIYAGRRHVWIEGMSGKDYFM